MRNLGLSVRRGERYAEFLGCYHSPPTPRQVDTVDQWAASVIDSVTAALDLGMVLAKERSSPGDRTIRLVPPDHPSAVTWTATHPEGFVPDETKVPPLTDLIVAAVSARDDGWWTASSIASMLPPDSRVTARCVGSAMRRLRADGKARSRRAGSRGDWCEWQITTGARQAAA
jgi:hypothetical protein